MPKVADIETLIDDGRIFSVLFVKRTNGELRRMVARLGVKKNIKGIGLPFNPTANNLIVVWDIIKCAYRMISCESIITLKHHGQILEFSPTKS